MLLNAKFGWKYYWVPTGFFFVFVFKQQNRNQPWLCDDELGDEYSV